MKNLLNTDFMSTFPSLTRPARLCVFFAWVALGCLAVTSGCGPDEQREPLSDGRMDHGQLTDSLGRTTPLKCPGMAGCEGIGGPLYVGVATEVITPAVEHWEDHNANGVRDDGESFEDLNGNDVWDPVWLAGAAAGRAATGVHDDLWARVLTVEKGDTSLGLVALDLIGLSQPDVVAIRRAANALGLGFDHIAVVSTHQQQGPDTLGMWGPARRESGVDPLYMAWVGEQVIAALRRAKADARVTTMRVGQTQAPHLVRDARLPEVPDHPVHTLGFVDGRGEMFASLVIWGNHPETLGPNNTSITSDFPHFLRGAMERYYPGSTSIFVNGILGGVTTPRGVVGCPDETGQQQCAQGTFERAAYIGEELAALAMESLRDEVARVDHEPRLALRRQPMMVGIENPLAAVEVLLGLNQRRMFSKDGRMVWGDELRELSLPEVLSGAWKFDSEVNALTLGPVQLLLVPGELYGELWRSDSKGFSLVEHPVGADFPDALSEPALERAMDPTAIRVVVNQSNDSLGHLIPRAQYDLEAPHAYEPHGQEGEESSLGAHVAEVVAEAVYRMFEL
ncbi:MAG: hypothetical protein VX834_03935 [Myxococcota bacterium]|nr:hypothetical protein [Myxococcota bacterium]